MNEAPSSISLHVPGLAPRPGPPPLDLEPFQVPHPSPFLCDIEVQPAQMSRAIDHVSNIEYVRWLDRAAELHADVLGYTRSSMLDRNLMWFVARHEIDYLAEVWPDDRLMLATWVRDMGRVKSWRDYVVLRPDESDQGAAPVCRAATLWVLVDLKKRKPARIPADMVERFRPLHGEPRRPGSPGRPGRQQDPVNHPGPGR
jgi:YbgC/YbaW family acyl-CoA thioester hydrolase